MRAAAGFPFDFAQDRTRRSGRKELALRALEDHPFIYQQLMAAHRAIILRAAFSVGRIYISERRLHVQARGAMRAIDRRYHTGPVPRREMNDE